MTPFREILVKAGSYLKDKYEGSMLDVVEVKKPGNVQLAWEWFSHFQEFAVLCNRLVESVVVDCLNNMDCAGGGWTREKRRSNILYFNSAGVEPAPRVIVKAWQSFPVEQPTRFSESGKLFEEDNVSVISVGWVMEHMVWGRVRILSVESLSARDLVNARTSHYFRPPDYVVCEEESDKFSSLITDAKQTRGYSFIGSEEQQRQAQALAERLGLQSDNYSFSQDYQKKLYQLLGRFPYREDRTYAIIDLIEQPDVVRARREALETVIDGAPVGLFAKLTGSKDDEQICASLGRLLKGETGGAD